MVFLFFENSHTGDAGVDVSPPFGVMNFVDYVDCHSNPLDANKRIKHLFVVVTSSEAGKWRKGGLAPCPFQVSIVMPPLQRDHH